MTKLYSDKILNIYLKGSYDVAKMNIIWCNAMHLWLTFPHTVHYCFSSMLRLSETRFYKAHHSEKYSSFSSMRRKCYALRHIVMPCPGATTQKTTKPIINEVFVASSGGRNY